jgi:hypothetical protein
MRLRSLSRFVAVAAAAVLPPLLLTVCIAFRLLEAWKLWHEFIRLAPWVFAYVLASLVTILELDEKQHLAYWERFINVSNTVTSLALALECAGELSDVMGSLTFPVRAVVLFGICLIAQSGVTLATGRGRVSRGACIRS